jgi:GNAT superfamily N-acetyltransferase
VIRLAELLSGAARGSPPAVDFETELVARPPGPVSAVLGFTGHHVVAADIDRSWLDATRETADFSSVMRAPFLAALGRHITARVGHLDLAVVRPAHVSTDPAVPLVLVELDLADAAHARLRRALDYRTEVRAWRTVEADGIVMIGRGLAGRWEVAFEVDPSARGRGLGRALTRAGSRLVPERAMVWAQASPGNVASVRVLLAAGFQPVGSEVLLHHGADGLPRPASRSAAAPGLAHSARLS